ncbi:acetyltransferase [Sphingomicrobium sediminis]|uniref:Acetyltransferase n=1 Tax=Sphingomicrobium sediminis TaxID=2950949 RepID=A0A9X2EFV8_9SPHN|nr:acetyltransferase [Sphingomicrobium sediminis]MCM8556641.1 acetyltransferase [Sphingomicrobium sediminis]
MSRLIGIYGASGFGREVMPVARATQGDARFVFVDDGGSDVSIPGEQVVNFEQFLAMDETDKSVAIAIADGSIRAKIAARCSDAGLSFATIAHESSSQYDRVDRGEGAILCAHATLTSDIRIGRHFHANIYSYVAHDCVIGDFVTFAPRVNCNGNVHIHDHAYIGTGAILRQGTPDKPLVIGEGAIVGMGAVVTRNVPPGATVVGNPARVMERK